MAVHGPYTIVRYRLMKDSVGPVYQEYARVEVRSKSDARKRRDEFTAVDGHTPDIYDSKGNELDLED